MACVIPGWGTVQHLASVHKELVWVSSDTQKTAACLKPMGWGWEYPGNAVDEGVTHREMWPMRRCGA